MKYSYVLLTILVCGVIASCATWEKNRHGWGPSNQEGVFLVTLLLSYITLFIRKVKVMAMLKKIDAEKSGKLLWEDGILLVVLTSIQPLIYIFVLTHHFLYEEFGNPRLVIAGWDAFLLLFLTFWLAIPGVLLLLFKWRSLGSTGFVDIRWEIRYTFTCLTIYFALAAGVLLYLNVFC